MDINYELYKIFYITVKAGSMSNAAKELFTSQSAVSQSIKLLENKLGGQLFHRRAQGVSLTAEGEILYQYVEQSYELLQAAERKFLELRNLDAGQLRIAVSTTACSNFLMQYLETFSLAYPNIEIYIKDQSTHSTIKQLESGEVDIGIINLNGSRDSLTVIGKIEIQDCFVVGERFKEICDKPIFLKELVVNYPIILMQKGLNTRKYIDNFFTSYGLKVIPKVELSTMELLIEFAKKGLGISCVIEDFVRSDLDQQQLFIVPIQEIIPKRFLSIAIKKDLPLSSAAQKFIELFQSCTV
ncbi:MULTISPECIES: LysR family transcriptional regulator [Paenibacillus]|uniref:LysR family transcriptional regulator n=1 Tax=Paenibacillus polymyxa TaxID=1406 RepID=A0AAP4E9H5_PAEPO|nr:MULTISPECIES: LysR family transcriptional regulator [Paenibacillus]APB75968.1 transcriptional regulator CynR [Paenibacillus polymyxa]MDH2331472.1 LysR family transcriptional regulator [Paenibacillus polymyxa]OMF81380.1 LysR family transcriptional regulator [Paenibacillus peoriae]